MDENNKEDFNKQIKKAPRLFVTDNGRFIVSDDSPFNKNQASIDFNRIKNDPDYRQQFMEETRGFRDICANTSCQTVFYHLDPCYSIDPYKNKLSGKSFWVSCPGCDKPVTGQFHSGSKMPIDAPIHLGCSSCGLYFQVTVSINEVIDKIKEMESDGNG